MTFIVDERIRSSCVEVAKWPLSLLYLKNESRFPWFILVPTVAHVGDLVELEQEQRAQLMQEITSLSQCIQNKFQPDKINIASLGNIVSQLHVHVVGRFKDDPYWPHSIWQPAYVPEPYSPAQLDDLVYFVCSYFAGI